MENNKSGNNFFSGFLLGALVGAAMVFLFGTAKGKKLLKIISEEGIDNISDILDKVDKSVELQDEDLENDEPVREFAMKEKFIEEKPKPRRFFRGISRHVN